jgi:antitoxin (DNA-binding transcriptional repressor) of toxin-antitoxin stability system
MLVISSREFRDRQKNYLDEVDNGVEILIQRGKDKAYRIVPVTKDDTVIGKEYILAPDEDFARAITGEELLKGLNCRIEKLFDK